MNILVVTDNFTMGGLETHIYTQFSSMKEKNKFVFAFGNYQSNYDFGNSKIYTDFNFRADVTINKFCGDVEKLVKIINDNEIDVIHVHPFYAIFPAVVASQITQTPIVYTYHGYSSYSFTQSNNQLLLFNYFLETSINIIFSVSETGHYYLKNHNNLTNVVYLPNSIDMNLYRQHNVINNKEWALISRLDNDKFSEIELLLARLKNLDIAKIDIYGEGNCKAKIQKIIKQLKLNDRVFLMGYCNDIHDKLLDKYNGIIGIGRVVMEGLTMGYPTLIIGHNKLSGIVDKNIFMKIKDKNFVNRILDNVSDSELNEQLAKVYKNPEKYNLSSEVNKNFSSKMIFDNYSNYIKNLEFNNVLGIISFYNNIAILSKNKKDMNEHIYESQIIYQLFKENMGNHVLTANVKNILTIFDKYYKLMDEQSHTNNLISDLNNKIVMLENKINRLEENKIFARKKWFKLKKISSKIINKIKKYINKNNNK